MFKEFVDEHNEKATRKANQFIEAKKFEIKGFASFADNLAKTHLVVLFEEAKEETKEEAPATKKPAAKKTTAKASTTTK